MPEAKPTGTILSGVEPHRDHHAEGMPEDLGVPVEPLPFLYMSTGRETRFRNGLDPDSRTRDVFTVHRPETLAGWLADYLAQPVEPTPLRRLPPLEPDGLWPAQELGHRATGRPSGVLPGKAFRKETDTFCVTTMKPPFERRQVRGVGS